MLAEVEPEAPVGGRYRATVTVVDTLFDASSGTFGVRLSLPNPDLSLPGGLRCKVSFLDQAGALEHHRNENGAQMTIAPAVSQTTPGKAAPTDGSAQTPDEAHSGRHLRLRNRRPTS